MRRFLVPILALFIAGAAFAGDSKCITKVGEDVVKAVETTHPVARAEKGQVIWRDEFSKRGASYIAVHFAAFDLAPGERVVVSSPDGKFAYAFEGRGRSASGVFWATHIPGDTAIVTYYAGDSGPGWGFAIDKFARGYPMDQWPNLASGATEGVCGGEDSINAVCYQVSEPDVYNNSKAVARLLSGGSALCTAWLVGCDGHVMTNNHCLATQADVDSADFEFMAEGATCGANCTTSPYCPGTVWEPATPGTFIQTNYNADYTLVKLPSNGSGQKPSDVYGFFRLRNALPTIDERIYLPGHPAGWGKRIAVNSDAASDQSGFCEVATLDYEQCQGTGGPLDISYYADTQGGSSGSPVVAYSDHRVISIHHCNAGGGACPNRGVPMNFIIADLQAAGNLPLCAIQQYAGKVELDANTYICDDIVSIKVTDDNLVGQPSQTVTIVSTTEAAPETVTLIPLPAPNDNTFIGSIPMTPTPPVAADGTLSVTNGDTITVTYIDLDDGLGGVNVPRTDTAGVDCVAPVITNVNATNVTGNSAQINWLTNEPATSIVRYGLVAPPGATSSNGALVTTHGWTITGLTECSNYLYEVASQDDAGNYVSDNNGLAYYTFRTGKNVSPTYTFPGPAVPIPDNNPAGALATINVPFFDFVSSVTVTVNVTHTFDGDLSLSLIAPDGTIVPLATRRGSSGDNFTGTTFDDAAATPISAGAAPFTGSFRPESPLSVLAGLVSYGDWSLKAVDAASIDTGSIVDWSLHLNFPAAPCGAQVLLDKPAYSCSSTMAITVKDTNVVGPTVTVAASSTTEPVTETVVLTRQAAPKDTWFEGSLPLAPPPPIGGNGQLAVVNGDTLTVAYIDADDGQGGTNVPVNATASTVCVAPVISNVYSSDVTGSAAVIHWTTDVATTSVVHYGLTIPPALSASSGALVTTHALALAGLTPCSPYFYSVESVDAYGNTVLDDNGGAYYVLTTLQNSAATYTSTDTPLPIPDGNPTGATSTINVLDLDQIADLNVLANITHAWDGDITLSLITPDGTTIGLSTKRGSSGDNYTNTVFDDAATTPIASGTPPFTGSFKPETPLNVVNGLSALGAWKLKVVDSTTPDAGTIVNWSLQFSFVPRVCGPSATYQAHTFTESCASGGPGSGNGVIDRGEDVVMPVTIRNNGTLALTGISGVLTTTTPGVTITTGTATFADVASGLTVPSNAPHYAFSVGATVPCGGLIAFNLAIQSAQVTTNTSFSVRVGAIATATADYASTDVPKPIPDSNTTGVTSIVTVADTNTVTDVNVTLNITHTYDGDLSLTLIGPNGTSVALSTRRGTSGDNFTNTVFDDAAATPISAGVAPFTGSFRPETPLTALNGIPANGTWTLKAVDGASTDVGTITGWTLQLTTAAGYVCTDCTVLAPTGEPVLLAWPDKSSLQWEAIPLATEYRVYRGVHADLAKLLTADPDSCLRLTVPGTSTGAVLTEEPAPAQLDWYLVRAANGGGEGPAGNATAGPRLHSSSGVCP